MVDAGDDEPDYAERISRTAEVERDAWAATLEDMEAMAGELEAEGWETLTIPAGDTTPEAPDAGDTDRFGLSHVVPGAEGERFADLFDPGAFPSYEVHRAEAGSRLFLVTTLMDPDREVAILIAGNFELRHAAGCVRAAMERGAMYTHVQTLDGTHLGSFRHDDYEKFFPNPERLIDWPAADGE